MIAVITVRDGTMPAGADEAVCEAGHRALLVGSNVTDAVSQLEHVASKLWTLEIDPLHIPPALMARSVAAIVQRLTDAENLRAESLVLPSSPDGRDLAPHLAHLMSRPLYAGATRVSEKLVTMARAGGLHLVDVDTDEPFVATLQVGIRGIETAPTSLEIESLSMASSEGDESNLHSVHSTSVQPPDAFTMDLAEATRILGGGAGLDNADAFEQLQRVGVHLGASVGVTRVITDRGWMDHTRQIGTTGVVVDPSLYIALGISGAVQHTSGLGHPDHIISINTDAHCPMMQIATVAIVADANSVLDELETLLQAKTSATEERQ